jgi:hypothetical protein
MRVCSLRDRTRMDGQTDGRTGKINSCAERNPHDWMFKSRIMGSRRTTNEGRDEMTNDDEKIMKEKMTDNMRWEHGSDPMDDDEPAVHFLTAFRIIRVEAPWELPALPC